MRYQKLSATILGLCLVSPLCMAAQSQQSKQTQKAPITLKKKSGGASTIRPKAPDRQVITCAYDGDALHLNNVSSFC